MTTTEIKARVYQQIAHLDDAQLEKLYKLLDSEFSPENQNAPQKRVGGKYKGQFVIKDDFDIMPEDFMAAFTKG